MTSPIPMPRKCGPWKMPEGHLTVFYTPDAPYADEETGLKVYIGSAYKFLVLRYFPDDESVVESVPVCDCGDTDITSSSFTNIVAQMLLHEDVGPF